MWGGGVPLPTRGRVWGGGSPLPRKKFSILDLRRILVQTESFLYSSPKAGFYQRVSIASYASAGIARRDVRPSVRRSVRLSVGPSVRPSITLRYCIKTKKASVMTFSQPESSNILVSGNIWFITKFERGHHERGQFMRLGWVRTGDFGEFSTNKPPYLRNGAR